MSKNLLFDSKNKPIPEVRRDLEIISVEENGEPYIYFHDARGYATSNLALHRQTASLLSLIDGRKSINDLKPYLGQDVTDDHLLKFIRFLDENGILDSQRLRKIAEEIEVNYEESKIHESVTAGSSYPNDPDLLKDNLDKAFRDNDTVEVRSSTVKALYAPHIDPRVAMKSYVEAFAPVRDLTPKRVVILATSHYAGLYPNIYENSPFVLVNKDFDLPLGTVQRDKDAISRLLANMKETGVTIHDRAHRKEHSIELHLLFLSYLWKHHFEVVPILVKGLDELYYMPEGHLGKQLEAFSETLRNNFENDEETFFLISGDLAHIGKKFGDAFPASNIFKEVKEFDQKFLEYAANNEQERLLELMRKDMDPYRICGFPPLYTFLQSMRSVKGTALSYDLWDETERESAVSYGSILFEKTLENK